MLDDIQVAVRPVGVTAKGRPTTFPTKMVAARFPTAMVEELEALEGPKSYHLEKALMLYLKALKAG